MLPDKLDEDLPKLAGCCQEDAILFLPPLFIFHSFVLIQTGNYAIVWSGISHSERSMTLEGDKLQYLSNSQFSVKALLIESWAGFSTSSYFH